MDEWCLPDSTDLPQPNPQMAVGRAVSQPGFQSSSFTGSHPGSRVTLRMGRKAVWMRIWWKLFGKQVTLRSLLYTELHYNHLENDQKLFWTGHCQDTTGSMGVCCDLNICILPKLICWSLIPKAMILECGNLGKWRGHEGGTLINGICASVKEILEYSMPLLPLENTARTLLLTQETSPYQTLNLLVP